MLAAAVIPAETTLASPILDTADLGFAAAFPSAFGAGLVDAEDEEPGFAFAPDDFPADLCNFKLAPEALPGDCEPEYSDSNASTLTFVLAARAEAQCSLRCENLHLSPKRQDPLFTTLHICKQ